MTLAMAIVLLLVLCSVVALFSILRIDAAYDRGFDICGGDGFQQSALLPVTPAASPE